MNKYARTPGYVLDLHGFTTKEAKKVLDEITQSGTYKHVRIITGKGTFRETGPVMRNFVKSYFAHRGIRLTHSKQADGGDGALEVYFS